MVSTEGLTRLLWRPIAIVALVAGLLAPTWTALDASAQSILPATAEAAPESTVIFHTMDLDRDGAQWQQTAALLARVGLPDALDLWEEAILEEDAGMGDFTAADLDALLGGEMAIAVSPLAVERFVGKHMQMMQHDGESMGQEADSTPVADASDKGSGVVGILEPGDLDAAWDYVRRQFTDLAAQRDVSVEESTYGDAEVLSVAAGEDAGHGGMDHVGEMDDWMGGHGMHGRSGIAAARAGDFIIAGKSVADVETIVDVIAGTTGSLADSAEAQAVAAELPTDALSFTYVDGQGLIDALGPDVTAHLQSFMPEIPAEAWGSQSGFAISADEPGFRFDSITIPGPGADLSAMTPDNDPAVGAMAEQAPAGTFIFQAGRLAETALLGAPYMLAQAVNAGPGDDAYGDDHMMMPTAEEMEQEIATAAATLEFDPRADLFELLGDEFIAFSSFPSLDFENFGIDAVAAVSTTDPGGLAETASKFAAWIDRAEPEAEVSARQIGSDTMYVLSSAEMGGAPALEFGVVEDQAVVAIGGGIDHLTTEPADSLADDAQFQTVMGLLPSEYYQVGYIDIGQLIQPLTMLMGLVEGMGDFDSGATDAAMATPEMTDSLGNIRALGAVSFQRGEMSGASAVLYIADEGT
ncbi:MAG: DUF3352 domain-containing protein [Thermomicrobiales bacterium]